MSRLVREAVRTLLAAGVELSPGLSSDELASIQRKFGFTFGPDHRDLLMTVIPLGQGWIDWRNDPPDRIAERLAWPIDGVLFDVENNAFWPASWGSRPDDEDEALVRARQRVAAWPKLVPVFAHRCIPAAPVGRGAPVFSVWQTDVVIYGRTLLGYLKNEFGGALPGDDDYPFREVWPWSQLAADVDDADL